MRFHRPSGSLRSRVTSGSISAAMLLCSAGLAHAEQHPAPPDQVCSLHGNAEPRHDVPVYGEPQAKEPLAVLTGVPIQATVSGFPRVPRAGRARIVTDADASISLEGYIAPDAVQLFTRRAVTVEPGLWIAPGAAVSYIGARPHALRVRLETPSLSREALYTWSDCDALGLDAAGVPALAVPKGAMPYLSTDSRIDIFNNADDSAEPWLALTVPAWSDGLVFWVTHVQRGRARVQYRDRFVVEGWTRTRWLRRLPTRQAIDPRGTPRAPKNLPALKLVGSPRLFEVKQPVPIRLRPTADASPIGSLRRGAEVYVTDDATAGWVGVLPKTLAVTAPGGGQFWIPAQTVAER